MDLLTISFLQNEYREKLAAYKRQVTRTQLSMLKLETQVLKEKEELKKPKPKRPVPSFILFGQELRKNTSKKLTASEIADKYNEMSDAERKIYTDKAKENSERYR